MKFTREELKEFLDEKVELYNRPSFIECDPISIPHHFIKKEDIEISGFLAASIAWGNRAMILRNAKRMMDFMDNSPYDFVLNHTEKDLERIDCVIHRTFNSADFVFFIRALSNIYRNYHGLEPLLSGPLGGDSLKISIHRFRDIFFEMPHNYRTRKHISDPLKGSATKRINMFLRWMVRKDNRGVDFGIWKGIKPSELFIPLDFHSGNTARKLGMLSRMQNDWKAVEELTMLLREFDPEDPVRYDFALFGLGVNERF